MRRALVLTTDSARHPFRASLPFLSSQASMDEIEPKLSWRRNFGIDTQDVRGFLMAYCACFLAVSAFLL